MSDCEHNFGPEQDNLCYECQKDVWTIIADLQRQRAEAKAERARLMNYYMPTDPECEHGMHYDKCPNVLCELRDEMEIWEETSDE